MSVRYGERQWIEAARERERERERLECSVSKKGSNVRRRKKKPIN